MSALNSRVPVSVIIPCYLSASTISRAVESVANQTRLPQEVLLIDDASPDYGQTVSVMNELKETHGKALDISVVALSVNSGPSSARNAGWELATQPYIAFLDADDSWHPHKLEIQYEWMSSVTDAAITGHVYTVVRENEPFPELADRWDAAQVTARQLLCSNRFSTPTVMLRRDIALRFISQKRYSEDYMLWLEIVLSGHKAYSINLPLAWGYKNRYGEGGLSSKMWQMEWAELDNYTRLVRGGLLRPHNCLFLFPYSLAKCLRRTIVSKFRAKSA